MCFFFPFEKMTHFFTNAIYTPERIIIQKIQYMGRTCKETMVYFSSCLPATMKFNTSCVHTTHIVIVQSLLKFCSISFELLQKGFLNQYRIHILYFRDTVLYT